jgi:hypothetical protein
MNHVHPMHRSFARLTRRAGMLFARSTAGPAAAAATRPGPARWTTAPPVPARRSPPQSPASARGRNRRGERLRTPVLPARRPHTIQLCIHCQDRPAGFWVSRAGGHMVRRPWCLSCCEELDRDSCGVIPFDP